MSEIDKAELEAAMSEGSEAEESAPEYTEIEQQAMEHGWNPEGAEGKRNLTAEEFMDRQPLYDDLRSQKKEMRRLRETVDALKQHNKTVEERTKQRVIEELKHQKKAALAEENYDAVVEIDERIAEAKQPTQEQSNEAFEHWVDSNEWYHDDQDMKSYADMVGTGYYQQNPNKSISEVYEYVTKEVKARFPDKFQNTNRSKPSPVEGASRGRSAPRSKYSVRDLPEEHRAIMKTLTRNGAISEEEYLKQYFG